MRIPEILPERSHMKRVNKLSTPTDEKTGSRVGPLVSWPLRIRVSPTQKAGAGVDAGAVGWPGALALCTISNTPESSTSSKCFY